MIRSNRIHIFLVLSFVVVAVSAHAQNNLNELKKKREKIENQITYTNRLISKVSTNKKSTLYALSLLNNKIQKRQELSATLKKESSLISDSIDALQISVKKLNQRLELLKNEYARIANFVYKHNNPYTRLAFLFSAKDINQAYQRMRYLSEISDYIRQEAEKIKNLEQQKQQKAAVLNRQIAHKKQLLDQQISQLSLLQMEQQKKNKLKTNLSQQENKLRSQLRAQRKESASLNRKIQDAIARAIADKKKKASQPVIKADTKLSATFYASKGRLPWPVDNGIVSQTFGVHNHPVIKHVKIRNNGINISTTKGSVVHAVYSGTVVSVVPITNTNIAIIVQHGDYFTVYSLLDKVLVHVGESVKTGQKLGVLHTNLQGHTELHFELWKGKQYQNPAGWLSKK